MTFPIPNEALENHIAILGKTGSGKSNAAKVIAERLLHAGKRVCAVDPTGTWWGLRLSEDGKHPSPWPVVIFGGEHADLPISAEHGAAIAETIGSSSTSAIIDTRQMSVGARTQFFTAFAETLIARNQGELALIIDEAHLFAPQSRVNDPKSSALVHATNNLVSLGRGVGLRIMLLSQRPAKLHKDSLTQVETLVAMRLIHNLDVDAVKTWIGEWADPAKGKEITSALPGLPKGDAFVWAPELDYLKRDHFPLVATFDTGKPLAGKKAPTLKAIDLEKIKERLTTVAKEALANDPKALRAEIAALKRELASKPVEKINTPDPMAVENAFRNGHAMGYQDGFIAAGRLVREGMSAAVANAMNAYRPPEPPREEIPQKSFVQSGFRKAPPQVKQLPKLNGSSHGEPMPGPQRKLLTVLAQYPSGRNQRQLAILAGYSHNGGAFKNPLANLRSKGWAEGGPDRIVMTEAGATALGSWEPLPQGDDLREYWFGNLPGPPAKLLRALCDVYPEGMLQADLAKACGYEPSGGAFKNPLSRLRSLELVTGKGGAEIRASEDLF